MPSETQIKSLTAASRINRLVVASLLLLLSLVVIYGGYFLYLGSQFKNPEPDLEVFRILTKAVLDDKTASDPRYVSVSWAEPSSNGCSFWRFDAIRVGCKGGTILVKDYKEGNAAELSKLVLVVANELSSPCRAANVLPIGQRESAQKTIGCGMSAKKFKLTVQAVSSVFVQAPDGSGIYRTKLIFETSSLGEIL